MSKLSDKLIKQHVLQQTFTPEHDSTQFLAYILLSQKYPNLTYWSMDGYSCDALADYNKDIVWDKHSVYEWTTKKPLLTTDKRFWDCTTQEIIDVWTRVNGETTKTKREWIDNA